jgi:hypothetical protein
MIYKVGYAASNVKQEHDYSYGQKSLRPIPLSHSNNYMDGLRTAGQAEAEDTVSLSTE